MGREAQIHKKMDKHGTCAHHCMDWWCLNTSLKHYRLHNCNIKASQAKGLSATVQFKHKSITNPSFTQADKLMQALAGCKAALAGLTNPTSVTDVRDSNISWTTPSQNSLPH